MPHPIFATHYTLCALAYGGGTIGVVVCGLFAQADGGGIKAGEWTALGLLVVVLGAVGAFLRWYLPARDAAFSADLKSQREESTRMLEAQRSDFARMLEEQRGDFARMIADQRDAFRELSTEMQKHHTTNFNLISSSRPPTPSNPGTHP